MTFHETTSQSQQFAVPIVPTLSGITNNGDGLNTSVLTMLDEGKSVSKLFKQKKK